MSVVPARLRPAPDLRGELARLVRFALVGLSNTVVTLTVFVALTHVGIAAGVASAAGFGAGAVNGYRLNRAWTFKGSVGGRATMMRYAAVQLFGAALSGAGVALATSDFALRHLAAEAAVLPAVTVVTYTLARRIVFRQPAIA